MVTRDSILSRKLPTEMILMPEWNGTVYIRRLTAREYLAAIEKIKVNPSNAGYCWIVAATFDENGNRIFNDEDAAMLEQKEDHVVITRLLSAIHKLNSPAEDAVKN